MKYAVVVERSPTGFAAYVPDLPGCVAAGGTPTDFAWPIFLFGMGIGTGAAWLALRPSGR